MYEENNTESFFQKSFYFSRNVILEITKKRSLKLQSLIEGKMNGVNWFKTYFYIYMGVGVRDEVRIFVFFTLKTKNTFEMV